MKNKYRYAIGIDPGVNTGIAVWCPEHGKFVDVGSHPIHKSIKIIESFKKENCFVRVEDARKRKWFGKNSNSKQQGAGSIKRDCKIWEDFLTDLGVDFEMIHPIRGGTKIDSKRFKSLTGWKGRTNSHSRDAAMLVYDFKLKKIN